MMDVEAVSRNGSLDTQTADPLSGVDFDLKRQGLSTEQVGDYFTALGRELEPIYLQFTILLRENDRLRMELARRNDASGQDEEHDQAVALLTQAQELADSLIDDAKQEARDLVWAARAHQRDVIGRVGSASADVADGFDSDGVVVVQSLAKMAQAQFLAVLDALTVQVNRLGDKPETDVRPSVNETRQAS